jgi:hypothetical protein
VRSQAFGPADFFYIFTMAPKLKPFNIKIVYYLGVKFIIFGLKLTGVPAFLSFDYRSTVPVVNNNRSTQANDL